MVKEPRYTLTKKYISAANQLSNKPTKATSTGLARSLKLMVRLEDVLKVERGQKLCESSNHNTNHGNVNKSLRGFW